MKELQPQSINMAESQGLDVKWTKQIAKECINIIPIIWSSKASKTQQNTYKEHTYSALEGTCSIFNLSGGTLVVLLLS